MPSLPTVGLLFLLPLIAWRLYARFRRLVGRQRLSRVRPWITLSVFPLLTLLLAYVAGARLSAWLVAGLGAGALLGAYGLRRTRFERTATDFFYTPNAHLGIALSLLFAGRLLYRLVELYLAASGNTLPAPFGRSPLTLAIFGLLAGYYVAYAIGLVRRCRASAGPAV